MSGTIEAPAASSPPTRLARARRRLTGSIKLRLVVVFVMLAAAMTVVFVIGAQRAFSVGWRDAARPLVADYVDRLASDITDDGAPSVPRAQALVDRLPITVTIDGPTVRWASHPEHRPPPWRREHRTHDDGAVGAAGAVGPARPIEPAIDDDTARSGIGSRGPEWSRLLTRTTRDGHTLRFGIDGDAVERRPHQLGTALALLLMLIALAGWTVRRLLKPLDAIGAGARRFGGGDFSQPIPASDANRANELGELATTINTMGRDIQQMLDAKRALLLAISHELRSPLTRARLNTELLPDTADVRPQRDALLGDLRQMAALIADLLESERLATRHAALQREPLALAALTRDVIDELADRHPAAELTDLRVDAGLPTLALDASRIRLLLRNLLDNAWRHGGAGDIPPQVRLERMTDGGVRIVVRDHGPGVPDAQLSRLADAFYRPDSARTRQAGGVGLGLYLCRLVAQAHGGSLSLSNARPGLAVTVTLPPAAT